MSPPIADYTDLVVPAAFAVVTAGYMATMNRPETPPPPYTRSRAPYTNSSQAVTSTSSDESRRSALKRIAEETLAAIHEGSYPYKGVDKELTNAVKEAKSKTVYYSPNSSVKQWASSTKPKPCSSPAHISILHISTLDAARLLEPTTVEIAFLLLLPPTARLCNERGPSNGLLSSGPEVFFLYFFWFMLSSGSRKADSRLWR
jgi:Uncharacterized protein conserved in bacteria (DUF2263)